MNFEGEKQEKEPKTKQEQIRELDKEFFELEEQISGLEKQMAGMNNPDDRHPGDSRLLKQWENRKQEILDEIEQLEQGEAA